MIPKSFTSIAYFFLILLGSCSVESTKIVTDFDYVKMTQSPNPLSTYYVKGTVRNMPLSFSTNDQYYEHTFFSDTTSKVFDGIRMKETTFSIGDTSGPIPVWFYLWSSTMTAHDFVTNMYVNQKFPMGTFLGTNCLGYPDHLFHAFLQVNYISDYGRQYRRFDCCSPAHQGELTITKIERFDTHVNVTLDFKGPLYSSLPWDVLFFGDADIQMCVRINF